MPGGQQAAVRRARRERDHMREDGRSNVRVTPHGSAIQCSAMTTANDSYRLRRAWRGTPPWVDASTAGAGERGFGAEGEAELSYLHHGSGLGITGRGRC